MVKYRCSSEALVMTAEAAGWYAGLKPGSTERYLPVVAEGGDLRERLLDYAARVVELVESLPKTTIAGRRIGDQLLRSGTSVGANYEEARAAESAADFIHKLQVALKELRESTYWLRLLVKTNIIAAARVALLLDESHQLTAILSKSVLTAKKNRDRGSAGRY
jgi:four helix bundle protein